MGKLGKKARKFAKKHLQSVLRQRRKTKALFKKRYSSKGKKDDIEEQVDKAAGLSGARIAQAEDIEDISLQAVFAEDDKNDDVDASDSDGYLSEESSSPHVDIETKNVIEDEDLISTYIAQNKELKADLDKQKRKLDRLMKKDPIYSKFLEKYKGAGKFQTGDMFSDEDDMSDRGEGDEDGTSAKYNGKLLTSQIIKTWSQSIKEDQSQAALVSLLNAYRAACHHGSESIGCTIQNTATFCDILTIVLYNVDDIFRGLLQIPSSNAKKEKVLELKKDSKWENLKPLIKSYLRSTLFLLNQVTDYQILVFVMTRLRRSLIFYAAFPPLMHRLIKSTIHLWATGAGPLSTAAFLIIQDISAMSGSNYLDKCLSKTFVAYISQSRVSEIVDIKHIQFLRDSIIELCSLNMEKSSIKALACISLLAKILRFGMQTKKKEVVKKMCSWEYVNCIDLWVKFISVHICDYDLQRLMFMTIQVINGLAHVFAAPRYFPLRLKCIQWLNSLSSSSGIFIPVASFVLDVLEYKVVKEVGRRRNAVDIPSVLKLPKHYLKTQNFQEECLASAIEQICQHLAQWSHHISFPELATIPLICLRKLHEIKSTEHMRRAVNRMIDQVEKNVEFVQKKRDEVSFSPNDNQSAEAFYQLEKSNLSAPFTQYYRSVSEKAAERSLHKSGNISLLEQRN